MRDFYGDKYPIDEILSGLKTYTLSIISLIQMNNSNYSSNCQYGYFDDSLNTLLSEYDDKVVLSKLEYFLNILKPIKYSDIKKAIPNDDWSDIDFLENERKQIFYGITDTINFINGLIVPRKILLSTTNTDSNNNEQPHENEELILSIFGYLKDEYMDISEWEILKEILCQFVMDLKVPEIVQKLKTPAIPIWEFLFLFRCLHGAIKDQSTNKIKVIDFASLITKIFTQFENREPDELSSKISNTTRGKKYSLGFPSKYKQ